MKDTVLQCTALNNNSSTALFPVKITNSRRCVLSNILHHENSIIQIQYKVYIHSNIPPHLLTILTLKKQTAHRTIHWLIEMSFTLSTNISSIVQSVKTVRLEEKITKFHAKPARKRCVFSWELKDDKDQEWRIFNGSEFQTRGARYWKDRAQALLKVDTWDAEKFLRGRTKRPEWSVWGQTAGEVKWQIALIIYWIFQTQFRE